MKLGSGLIWGDCKAAVVVGTLRSSLDSVTSALVSKARYFTSCQAAAGCLAPLGMPMMLPLMKPAPYWPDWSSAAGNGAVAYLSSGCSSARKATRHSPSNAMAILPVSKTWEDENSSPAPATTRVILS